MLDQPSTSNADNARQFRLVAIVFGVFVGLLVLGYLMFLRWNYAVLYADLAPQQAGAIIAELEAREIDFKVDDGRTILVSASQADEVRLAIEGARSPLNRIVGFELFNESDMGLTDFAQRIKYQRALEGELSRTIMMIDGIEQARVHVSMPERALFRSEQVNPKAAVSITTAPTYIPGRARILGMQKLVAAAVPNLSVSDVVILNEAGETISANAEPDLAISDPGAQTSDQRARQILRQAEHAVETAFIGLEFTILVAFEASGQTIADETAPEDRPVRMTLLTDIALSDQEKDRVWEIMKPLVGLSREGGDSLDFRVRAVPEAQQTMRLSSLAAHELEAHPSQLSALADTVSRFPLLVVGILTGIGLFVVMIAFLFRRSRGQLSREQQADFASRLRAQIGHVESVEDV